MKPLLTLALSLGLLLYPTARAAAATFDLKRRACRTSRPRSTPAR